VVLRTRKGREAEALVLIAIHDLWDERGYAPTVREIGARIGMAHSAVHGYTRSLAEAGLVHEEPNIARSLRLSAAGHDRVAASRHSHGIERTVSAQ
jgi:SOS-response transcriptional repressor LexA